MIKFLSDEENSNDDMMILITMIVMIMLMTMTSRRRRRVITRTSCPECLDIDLHVSKPLISLVPITCTTYCFQGYGHCYVTIPIVFPAYHKPCLQKGQVGPNVWPW